MQETHGAWRRTISLGEGLGSACVRLGLGWAARLPVVSVYLRGCVCPPASELSSAPAGHTGTRSRWVDLGLALRVLAYISGSVYIFVSGEPISWRNHQAGLISPD